MEGEGEMIKRIWKYIRNIHPIWSSSANINPFCPPQYGEPLPPPKQSIRRVYDFNYLFIECNNCDKYEGRRVKLAKNKLAYWNAFEFLEEFLIKHSDCDHDNIHLVWEK